MHHGIAVAYPLCERVIATKLYVCLNESCSSCLAGLLETVAQEYLLLALLLELFCLHPQPVGDAAGTPPHCFNAPSKILYFAHRWHLALPLIDLVHQID